ncbi:MAG: integron integrase, partial [Candidatus Roizmanbacteria bacterium]|nr:integron integrase [Candidatus Roizmanbacteria bacterium]
MQPIPSDILTQFDAVLKKRSVSVSRHEDYRKWLLYYLDFRGKYMLPDSKSEQVRLFIEKLQKKNQTPEQQKQAAHALSLFFESQPRKKGAHITPTSSTTPQSSYPLDSGDIMEASVPPPLSGKRFNEWRCLAKSSSPAWDKIIDTLVAEIKTRHYSRKTLKTYADWSRKFQSYLRNKPPDE